MITTQLAGLLVIWFLAVVSPGPAFLVLSQLAVGRSRACALGAALGQSVGAILYAALTLWGLAVVVTQVAWLGSALRIAGAVYLIYLGLSLFLASSSEAEHGAATRPAVSEDAWAGFRIGFLTAMTNPKAIAFFVSLFAVALPADMTTGERLFVLACGFAMELSWYVFVALALSSLKLRALYARARKPIDRVLGAALLLVGVRLGVDR